MPYPKKFDDPYVTSVRLERLERKIAKALHIDLSDALRFGLNITIKDRIASGDPFVTSEVLEDFKIIEAAAIKDLEGYIRLKNTEQVTLDKMVELRKEAEKGQELIEVYDRGTEEYIHIPENQFDPEWHIKRVAA
jgi:hypothetical protein